MPTTNSPVMRRTLLILCLALTGCASVPATPPDFVSLGAQLKKQDTELVGQQFRTILDFENTADAVFVRSASSSPAAGHTGSRSLRVSSTASVNISSLLFGATLPADWTLLGGYVRPFSSGVVNVSMVADGQTISRSSRPLIAGVWAFAGIDLTDPAYAAPLAKAKSIELVLSHPAGFDLDDVMLVNNRRRLVDWPGVWSIDRRGFELNVNVAGQSPRRFILAAADAHGVEIEEINPLRVRLRDKAGQLITLLPNGRTFNGATPLPDQGQIDIADTDGKLNRETPGDLNNDGFNEERGAYQITAAAPRLTLRLSPARSAIEWPLLEVRGLPAESDTVTADGKLIEKTARLPDGTLLILLPMTVDSPVEITVGVSGR